MKVRKIRIWLSRGWYRTLCSISLLLLPLFCNTGRAFAAISHVQQDTIKSAVVVSGTKPQAGDIISGTICDENGPMQLVNITERDSLYRIVAHAVSDVNGKFAFKLVNPANRLSVTYVGYGEAITAITGTSFDVTMVELPDLPVVDLSSDVKQTTMYGPPAVNYNRYYDPNAQPAVRDFIEIGARTPDVSVMYGVPTNRYVISDDKKEPASAPSYPLIVLDGEIVNAPHDKLAAFDFNAVLMDRYQLAELVGIRGDKIKAVRTLNNKESEDIWGAQGKNGVLEVLTRKYYRKVLKYEKTIRGTKQPITGLKNKE